MKKLKYILILMALNFSGISAIDYQIRNAIEVQDFNLLLRRIQGKNINIDDKEIYQKVANRVLTRNEKALKSGSPSTFNDFFDIFKGAVKTVAGAITIYSGYEILFRRGAIAQKIHENSKLNTNHYIPTKKLGCMLITTGITALTLAYNNIKSGAVELRGAKKAYENSLAIKGLIDNIQAN